MCSTSRRNQTCPRIAHAWSPSVAYIGDTFTLLHACHYCLRRFGLVMLVDGEKLASLLVNAIGAQHALGVSRILTGQGVRQLQHMKRAQCDVCQVADGGRDDIQGRLRIVLLCGRVAGGAQG